MKIIVSQKEKKLLVEFHYGGDVYKCAIAKAEEFLVCIDKLLKKRHTVKISDFKNAKLEFDGRIGMLTERVVRAIMLGFRFSY